LCSVVDISLPFVMMFVLLLCAFHRVPTRPLPSTPSNPSTGTFSSRMVFARGSMDVCLPPLLTFWTPASSSLSRYACMTLLFSLTVIDQNSFWSNRTMPR
jgi:hypothetical protein